VPALRNAARRQARQTIPRRAADDVLRLLPHLQRLPRLPPRPALQPHQITGAGTGDVAAFHKAHDAAFSADSLPLDFAASTISIPRVPDTSATAYCSASTPSRDIVLDRIASLNSDVADLALAVDIFSTGSGKSAGNSFTTASCAISTVAAGAYPSSHQDVLGDLQGEARPGDCACGGPPWPGRHD